MPPKKYKKMNERQRKLASKYIAEETRAKKNGKKKYKRTQAIAVGISRALKNQRGLKQRVK